MKKRPMTGTVAANPHQGSRSEVLADYLFSGWGTVTPVRRQDDFGVDLYCTLTEREGQRALVRDYFTVQVKSDTDPWEFHGDHAVRWLVEYPSPLFLACVDKKAGILRVYHTMPRFLALALGFGSVLKLVPDDVDHGGFVKWENGQTFSLSAPVLRLSLSDLLNEDLLKTLRAVFAKWVRMDRENCDLLRMGLLRFRMPDSYTVNELPTSLGEMGNAAPNPSALGRGILTAAEAIECIGGQLGRHGDRVGALWAALVVDHLQQNYPDAFNAEVRWRHRVPGDLGRIVCAGLNAAITESKPTYAYAGLEHVENLVMQNPLVARYVSAHAPGKSEICPEPSADNAGRCHERLND